MFQIALVDSGNSLIAQQFENSAFAARISLVDMYDLSKVDLSSCRAMLVPGSVDQEWCLCHSAVFRDFLEQGKVIAFSGAIFRPWLPGASNFVPKAIQSRQDYALEIVKPGGIFDGVSAQDLTVRQGVAGFFARGHHPLPFDAEVLVAFASGEPVVYVDRASTSGTILAHSGNDLWSYGLEDSSSQRILPQLLHWIDLEYSARQGGRRP
jgi:hypothetical protein